MKITENKNLQKIGFGGGCHWCTEAVFQSLIGVENVRQGWVASYGEDMAFSEAVILEYDAIKIPLEILIEVHLHTHKSRSQHSMRKKYRSAIYLFNTKEEPIVSSILKKLQSSFESVLITQVLQFSEFKPSREALTNYYYKNPQKPFCETFINPKLNILRDQFSTYMDPIKTGRLNQIAL